MRVKVWAVLFFLLLIVGTSLAKDKGETFDACRLITRSEIEAVQGEPVVDTKSSTPASGGFEIAQCYYTLPSHTKSVSLQVTRPDPRAGALSGPRDRWQELFHGEADHKGEKKSGRPQAVPGVGDEAFWSGDAMVGALYVLKGNTYFRISIGGSEEASVKISKAKALAARAVKRLS